MRTTLLAWKTCWRCMKGHYRKRSRWFVWMKSRWCCMPTSVLRGPCDRAALPDATRSTNVKAQPTSSVVYNQRRGNTSPKQLRIVPRPSSPIISWRSPPTIQGRNHPPGYGQFEYAQAAPRWSSGSERKSEACCGTASPCTTHRHTAVGSIRRRSRSVCLPASAWAGEEFHPFHNCSGKHWHGTENGSRPCHHQLEVYALNGTPEVWL